MNQDEKDSVLFLVLLGLAVAIGLLGFFVLARLRREGGSEQLPPSPALLAVAIELLFALAVVSTFFPPAALVPALAFFILGLRLLLGAGSRRDGGVVLMLLAIAWGIFMKIQADVLASGADIRVDLCLTVPVMTGIGALGWRIHTSES